MVKIRNIITHFVLLLIILFFSFANLYVYKKMPDVREMMHQINDKITFEYLVVQSIHAFFQFIICIYFFYFFIYNWLAKSKFSYRNLIYVIGSIALLIMFQLYSGNILFPEMKSKNTFFGQLIFNLVFGGIGFGARAISESFKEKDKRKELEKRTLQTELGLLRSQINPHFLFNTLNNIDALIKKEPEQASDLLIKLSVQMRYMLYDSNTEKIDLKSEIEFINDYVSLQKLRIKNKNAIHFTMEGDFNDIKVPPMLFIPFIENAFKHCCNFNNKPSIIFSINKTKEGLMFCSENPYDPENNAKDKVGGIGINLVKKRLDLIYPEKYNLDILTENNIYKVCLKIILNED